MRNYKRLIHLLLGPVLFLLACFLLPHSVLPTFAERAAVGTVFWMAYWWVTGPVDYAVTAFLPIAINAVVPMAEMKVIISNYADETILLLLGASIITVLWENTGLDKRIAITFLRLIGNSLRMQLVFWFALSMVLSAVLPNAVVCATITPIAVSMLKYIGMDDVKNSKTASKILLTIAYATGLGGLASPLGGAMNLVTVEYLKEHAQYCTGTSNCHLAMKYDMRPMGTHPHEWFMFHGAQFGYKHANYMALENWVNVYDGDLGTALSDTYTSDSFLSNFSRKQAKLFDGVRCDSGDEYEFIERLIARYKELGIDPTTKTIIFSNALDFEKALKIYQYCQGKIRCSFGIGTNLTNDTGYQPSNIVMKLSRCKMSQSQEWRECVKLSDDMGKHMGSMTEVEACLHELRLLTE